MGLGRRGDDEFVEFARASSARLQRAAYLLTGDRHQAEEAAQAALVRVYASWGRVRRKDPYAYARTVLANLVTDQWRRPLREYATEQLPERPMPRDVADDVTRRRWLVGALKALSPRERTVIVMRHFFDITEVDVARELNLSLGTVKSLNSRALAKLRISIPSPRQGLESGAAR
ncbi:SigE family RNA polymerase sigma factor [Actinoplanes sp. NPDC051475]|uniref:SigE family RNA polymerase sigma factor n=1 Tax=Actinoplanes sp. NPDC051475 TaxID=3157225 RepID=UPI00344BDD60